MQSPSAPDSAIQAIDDLLGSVGLEHGHRRVRRALPNFQRQEWELKPPAVESGLRLRKGGAVPFLEVPSWQAEVAHGFSTRAGGCSTVYSAAIGDESDTQPVGELNLGFTTVDEAEHVERNRVALLTSVWAAEKSAVPPLVPKLVTLRQIHSGLTHRVRTDVGAAVAGITAAETAGNELRGDGLMTDHPGVMLGVQTADCVPVLVFDRRRGAVAAFHAGWRGTLKRIVEGGIGRMRLEFGSKPEDLEAAVGPAVGGCCYAVGEEVRSEFASQFSYADALFREVYDSDPVKEKYPLLFMTARAPGHSNIGPSLHLDLAEANRRQLEDAGLSPQAIHMAHTCTACHPAQFFSYRAERGFCGRMMAVIGRRG